MATVKGILMRPDTEEDRKEYPSWVLGMDSLHGCEVTVNLNDLEESIEEGPAYAFRVPYSRFYFSTKWVIVTDYSDCSLEEVLRLGFIGPSIGTITLTNLHLLGAANDC